MKTITIKGGVYTRPLAHAGDHPFFAFFSFSPVDSGYLKICDHTITVEVPPDFDPRAAEVKALEAKREALRKEFAESVRKIDQRINSLLAIGCATEVAE